MKRLISLGIFSLLLLFLLSVTACFPESAVRQKKIDRERRQNEKKAQKAYQLDLKKHHKGQSKETRSMMKKSKRKSKKVTPLRK